MRRIILLMNKPSKWDHGLSDVFNTGGRAGGCSKFERNDIISERTEYEFMPMKC